MKKETIKRRKRVVPAPLRGGNATVTPTAASRAKSSTSSPASTSHRKQNQHARRNSKHILLPGKTHGINGETRMLADDRPGDASPSQRPHPPVVDFTGYSFNPGPPMEQQIRHRRSSEMSASGSPAFGPPQHQGPAPSPSAMTATNGRTSPPLPTDPALHQYHHRRQSVSIQHGQDGMHGNGTDRHEFDRPGEPPTSSPAAAATTGITAAERLPSITSILNPEQQQQLPSLTGSHDFGVERSASLSSPGYVPPTIKTSPSFSTSPPPHHARPSPRTSRKTPFNGSSASTAVSSMASFESQ